MALRRKGARSAERTTPSAGAATSGTLTYEGFLAFRAQFFPMQYESVDPAFLCRFGEYNFACAGMDLRPGQQVLDLACSVNIFQIFLAYEGLSVTGIDIDPDAEPQLRERLEQVAALGGRPLDHTFLVESAYTLPFPEESFDRVISISSVEHMFTDREADGDHGDRRGIIEARRVLRKGGRLVVTFPMSEGGPFHESPTGDEHYALPYRRYTWETVDARFGDIPGLRLMKSGYIPHESRLPFGHHADFAQFWGSRTAQERLDWDRFAPVLADRFQPLVYRGDDVIREDRAQTGLLAFEAV